MSREAKLVKNTLVLSIGTFLPKFAAFITVPVLTACLSKEQYGIYDLITILVSLILPVATLQIHTAGFRFLIDHKNDRNLAKLYFSNILAFVIPVATVSLGILYVFLPVADVRIKLWVLVYLFFDTIVTEVGQITRGLSQNLDYSISSIVYAAAKMLLTVLLVEFLRYELLGAVIALAVSPIMSLLFLAIKIRIFELVDFSMISRSVLKEMLSYSWPMVPNNLSGWVMRVSDRFVVSYYMGLSSNAVYAVANKIPHLLLLAQNSFAMAWQENASIASKDSDAGKYYSKMFMIMTNFYSGCLGLIIACTPILFRLLIRGDYKEAYPQMPVLFLAMFFSCMASFQGGIYIACKATKSVGITTVFAALCNLVVDLALIRRAGLYAASGSTLVSYIVLFIYRMVDVRKYVKIKYDYPHLVLALAVIVTECVVCHINRPVFNILNLCLGITAFFFLNRQIGKSFFFTLKSRIGKYKAQK